MHASHAPGSGSVLDLLVTVATIAAIAAYVGGVRISRRKGRQWPWHRVALWCTGIVVAAASVAGPLATAAHESFVAHMTAHLAAGMIAPVMLVLAAPVTLALRALHVTPARRLARLLASRPVSLIAHPLTAALISVGGLWLIYLGPVAESMRHVPLIHVAVHGHLVLAGYLFTAAVIGLDPRPHAPSRGLTAVVLVLSIAAHGILAKHLFAHPPSGFSDVQAGAQLMYYAGAWVEAVVIVIFCARWYRATDPRRRSLSGASSRAA
ncbi:cytochrome c oxidase assembly protein [Microbacterium sp. CPCC 204701]|uniref:cytochrome c oxidase assembly protein n=1 Tax=Microbacterium sp. CPCC 204701 TaxID=2493084 RepID=UPI001F0C0E7D|nr:cytochrome c oxidase assembly protein [Microbacterium sp. CPCC 204701]